MMQGMRGDDMHMVTADQMREMDRLTIESFGIPGRVLMENAGRCAANLFMEDFPEPWDENFVGVIAGRGNNGGDGHVIARYLHQQGIKTAVYLLCERDKVMGNAAANLNLLDPLGIPIFEIPDAKTFSSQKKLLCRHTIFIDAILGTGLKSDVRGHFKDIIQFINDLKRPVYSVDMPSGLNSDTGQTCGECIRAHVTATFGFPKIGQIILPGAEYVGRLEVVDIGIPKHIANQVNPKQRLITPEYIQNFFKPRKPDAHKGDAGHVLVIAGSPGKTGAAAMAGMSAMRAGAGLVTIGIPKSVNPIIEALAIEAMTLPLPESNTGSLDMEAFDEIQKCAQDKRCLAIGPGLGVDSGTKKLVQALVANARIPLVIDADGLSALAEDMDAFKKRPAPMIITPHPGEMAKLAGASVKDIQKDRIGWARKLSHDLNAHLVLKGAKTIVASPDGSVYINPTGNPGMASGGMGDVLTGIIAGLVSQGFSMEDAAVSGVFIHGAAGDDLAKKQGAVGFLATDVMDRIPRRMSALFHKTGGKPENHFHLGFAQKLITNFGG